MYLHCCIKYSDNSKLLVMVLTKGQRKSVLKSEGRTTVICASCTITARQTVSYLVASALTPALSTAVAMF